MKVFYYVLVTVAMLTTTLRLHCLEFFGGIEMTHQKRNHIIPSNKATIKASDDNLIPLPKPVIYKLNDYMKTVATGGFEPYHDTPSFVNFHSVARDINRVKRYTAGTCHGVSYITAMWYAGIYKSLIERKPSKKENEVQFIGSRDLIFSSNYDGINQICKESDPNLLNCSEENQTDAKLFQRMDGINYIASMAKLSDAKFFNKCGTKLRKCRLFEVSNNVKLTKVVKQTMAHHQNQQMVIDDVVLKVNEPKILHLQIKELKKRIQKHGTVMFYWLIYNTSEAWEVDGASETESTNWNQFEAGHSMLIYKMSEVKVRASGSVRKALKLHLYDPNLSYRNLKKLATSEGFGSYLLYFSDSNTITFSNAAQSFYSENSDDEQGDSANIAKNLQGGYPTIDGRQTIIGFSDFYEGHQDQFKDAVGIGAFAQSFEATQRDQDWFASFVKYKDCATIKSRVAKLKQSDDPKVKKLLPEFVAWFNRNYEALQTHLRDHKIITQEQTCDPF